MPERPHEDDRDRRRAAVERELRRLQPEPEHRDLVETVGEEQRRERAVQDDDEDRED